MIKIRTEAKLGIFFIATLAIFIWAFNFLKGRDLFQRQIELFAVYDHVSGLVPANAVSVNGLKVGTVKDVYFEGRGSTRIVVEMLISSELEIPYNSIARIYSADLLGSKAIDLILGNSPILAHSGDTLQSDIQATLQEEVHRQVAPIRKKAEDLLLSIDSVMIAIQAVFNVEARENIARSFESIHTTINNLQHTSFTIDTLVQTEHRRMAVIFENIESISANLRANNQNLTNVIHNVNSITDSIAAANLVQTVVQLDQALIRTNRILEKIDAGEGSLGMLINDPNLYNELNQAATELNSLTEDIRLNPDRYIHFSVFGRRGSPQPTNAGTE